MEGSANIALPFFVRQKGVASRVSAFAAPTPVGAGGGRVALLAVRRRRNSLGVSLLLTFLFAPAVSKRKVAMGAETQDGCCFRAEFTLASPVGRGGTACRDGEGFFSPLTRFAGAPPEGEPFVNRRTKSKPRYSRFFFCPCRPKRKSLAKRKRPRESFARCDARPRLRALDGRHLAVGLSPSEVQYVAALCVGRALARGNTLFVSSRSRASVALLPSREKSPNCRKKYLNLLKFHPNSVIIS